MNLSIRLTLLSWICFALSGCLYPVSVSDHEQFVTDHVRDNPAIIAHDLSDGGFNLHYRSVGSPRDAVALWVHGTPGGWSDISQLMMNEAFTRQVLLVSIDRPGWGRSQYVHQSRVVETFAEQSRLISPLIKKLRSSYPGKPLILVGHSWGASLVPTIASEHKGDIDGVLALAAPFDPDLAAPRWYNRAARMGIIKRMIGEGLRRSNVEMYALPGELRAARPVWQALDVPIIIMQGQDDKLVPAAHMDFAKRIFVRSNATFVLLEDQGHLVQFERSPLIGRCILALARHNISACSDSKS